jgi:hypothetical protein
MLKRGTIEVFSAKSPRQEGMGKAEVEIERYLSSLPQRPASKAEKRRAVTVLKLRQRLNAVRHGRAMVAAVWLKDAELNVFSSHRSGRKASKPL